MLYSGMHESSCHSDSNAQNEGISLLRFMQADPEQPSQYFLALSQLANFFESVI